VEILAKWAVGLGILPLAIALLLFANCGSSSSAKTHGGSGTGGTTAADPPAGCPDAPAAGVNVFYACDCGSNADKDCKAGNDSNPGTSPDAPWQTFGKAQSQFAALNAGDRIEFCQGGSFTITGSNKWVNGNCRADNRCVVASYAAPWASGDEGRPVIHSPGGQHGIAFDEPANADHEEGYVFAGLELVGSGTDSGFFVYNDIDDVLICDTFIHDFSIGVQLSGSNPPNPGADTRNERIVLRDSIIKDNGGQGWLGGDNGSAIMTSRFENNGFDRAVFNHNIYLSMDGASGVQVIGNDLYRSAVIDGKCMSVSLVGHGVADGVLIAGNTIHEDLGTVDQGCWGIAIDPGYASAESFDNVTISGNTVTNVGNQSIGVASCHDCTIENNIVVNQQQINGQAILAPSLSGNDNDATNDHITIRNNSIDIDVGQGIGLVQEGTGHIVVSNAIYSAGGGNGGVGCFRLDLPAGAYVDVDGNACFMNGHGEWVVGQGSLAAWTAKTGFDAHSMAVDPEFKSVGVPYDLTPTSTSPLVDNGDPKNSAATDITGKRRDTHPDIGAYEQ